MNLKCKVKILIYCLVFSFLLRMLLKARLDNTHIVLFGASPEVDTACIAGDVEDSQALQTRQRHGNPVTLWTEERRLFKTRKTQQVCRNQLTDICFPKDVCLLPPAELSALGSCTSSGPALWSPGLRTTSCSWCDYCRGKSKPVRPEHNMIN